MPRRKPAPPASSHLRRAIASAAARLMAEEGIGDYGAAKRKAARQLGAGEGESLPANEEVEAALRDHLALYQDEELQERLRDLRTTALDVMELLADYHPYLTGAVLEGTAGRYASVEIELFADSSKDVEITLLSRGISYEITDSRRPGIDAQLRLEWNGNPVLLSIYPPMAERQRPKPAHGGRQRLRADGLARLIQENTP